MKIIVAICLCIISYTPLFGGWFGTDKVEEQVKELNRQIDEKNKQIKTIRDELSDCNRRVNSMNDIVSAKDMTIEQIKEYQKLGWAYNLQQTINIVVWAMAIVWIVSLMIRGGISIYGESKTIKELNEQVEDYKHKLFTYETSLSQTRRELDDAYEKIAHMAKRIETNQKR